MSYPDKLTTIFHDLELYLPDDAQVKPVYESLLASNAKTPFPFWARTWPAAFELASFLREEKSFTAGKQILELGAGTALPSFAISNIASTVTISDHAADAVALMNKNIAHLQLQNVNARQLDWNFFPDDVTADVLLLSDINYATDQFTPLLSIIHRFIDNGRTVILSTPQRINITPFAEALQPFTKHSVLRVHANEAVEIRLLVLSK